MKEDNLWEKISQLPYSKRAFILSGIVGIIENDESELAITIKNHIKSKIKGFSHDED